MIAHKNLLSQLIVASSLLFAISCAAPPPQYRPNVRHAMPTNARPSTINAAAFRNQPAHIAAMRSPGAFVGEFDDTPKLSGALEVARSPYEPVTLAPTPFGMPATPPSSLLPSSSAPVDSHGSEQPSVSSTAEETNTTPATSSTNDENKEVRVVGDQPLDGAVGVASESSPATSTAAPVITVESTSAQPSTIDNTDNKLSELAKPDSSENQFKPELKPEVETPPRPPVEEVKPTTEESKPTIEESKPKVEEVKPTIEESKPKVDEVRPSAEEAKPTVEEAKPESKEVKPTTEESKPTIEETKPASEEAKPTFEETKPPVEEPKLVVDKTEIEKPKPEIEEPKPVFDEPKAEIEKPKPEIEEPKPVFDESKAEIVKPKPEIEEPKPVFDEPKAEIEKPKPEIEEPKPVFDEPKAEIEKPKPEIEEPKPVFDEPKAEIEKPKPEIEEPKPVFDEPKTEIEKPKPEIEELKPKPEIEELKPSTVETNKPTAENEAPTFASQPTTEAPAAPSTAEPEISVSNNERDTSTTPVVSTPTTDKNELVIIEDSIKDLERLPASTESPRPVELSTPAPSNVEPETKPAPDVVKPEEPEKPAADAVKPEEPEKPAPDVVKQEDPEKPTLVDATKPEESLKPIEEIKPVGEATRPVDVIKESEEPVAKPISGPAQPVLPDVPTPVSTEAPKVVNLNVEENTESPPSPPTHVPVTVSTGKPELEFTESPKPVSEETPAPSWSEETPPPPPPPPTSTTATTTFAPTTTTTTTTAPPPPKPANPEVNKEKEKTGFENCNFLPTYDTEEVQKVYREETTFRNGTIKGKFTYISFDQRYRLVHYTRLPYGPVKIDRVEELGKPVNRSIPSDFQLGSRSEPNQVPPNGPPFIPLYFSIDSLASLGTSQPIQPPISGSRLPFLAPPTIAFENVDTGIQSVPFYAPSTLDGHPLSTPDKSVVQTPTFNSPTLAQEHPISSSPSSLSSSSLSKATSSSKTVINKSTFSKAAKSHQDSPNEEISQQYATKFSSPSQTFQSDHRTNRISTSSQEPMRRFSPASFESLRFDPFSIASTFRQTQHPMIGTNEMPVTPSRFEPLHHWSHAFFDTADIPTPNFPLNLRVSSPVQQSGTFLRPLANHLQHLYSFHHSMFPSTMTNGNAGAVSSSVDHQTSNNDLLRSFSTHQMSPITHPIFYSVSTSPFQLSPQQSIQGQSQNQQQQQQSVQPQQIQVAQSPAQPQSQQQQAQPQQVQVTQSSSAQQQQQPAQPQQVQVAQSPPAQQQKQMRSIQSSGPTHDNHMIQPNAPFVLIHPLTEGAQPRARLVRMKSSKSLNYQRQSSSSSSSLSSTSTNKLQHAPNHRHQKAKDNSTKFDNSSSPGHVSSVAHHVQPTTPTNIKLTQRQHRSHQHTIVVQPSILLRKKQQTTGNKLSTANYAIAVDQ